MVWEPEIDELNHRKHLAEQMGGEEGVAQHHAQGKLTVRERITAIADPGSFRETGALTGNATYGDDQKLTGFTPQATVVGVCSLNGRNVVISGGDSTIGGGLAGPVTHGGSKTGYSQEMAAEWQLPFVDLVDPAAGGGAALLGAVPVVSAIMGTVDGVPPGGASCSHFSVMVKAALGAGTTDEEIKDRCRRAFDSGVVDNLAETEAEALAMVKRFLDYLPGSVWQAPPRAEAGDDPHRRDEELLSIVPRDRTKGYDPYQILSHVMDRDSFLELSTLYGQSRITGLARVNGYPVAVMINNPAHLDGAIDTAARLKVIRFLNLCDTFHLPLVCFSDEPGAIDTPEAQKQGAARIAERLSHVTGRTRMPWITFVIGAGGQLNNRGRGAYRRYGWPSAHWAGTSAFQMAERFGIEEIIDPRETRPVLSMFIELMQPVIETQLGPTRVQAYEP